MKRFSITALVLLVVCLISNCSSKPPSNTVASPPGVSEISFGYGGSQNSYWYQIAFFTDGTAKYIGDVAPELRGKSEPFGKVSGKATDRVKYRGKISAEEFDRLSKLIVGKGFLTMEESYGGVSGAAQTTISVVNDGKLKEVHNQIGQGGENLAEIERAINQAADKITWEKE